MDEVRAAFDRLCDRMARPVPSPIVGGKRAPETGEAGSGGDD
jgi:hypothetical protein